MLQSWAVVQDATTSLLLQPLSSQKEAPEQRENRLRASYEQALLHIRNGAIEKAQSAFRSLVDELNELSTASLTPVPIPPSGNIRPPKRPRLQPGEFPLWARRLRYVALRNLAETCTSLGDHIQALHSYSSALDDDRSDFVVWLGAARAAAAVGRLHVARRAYEAALAMRPRHWLAARPYRVLLAAIGDTDDDLVLDIAAAPTITTEAHALATRRVCALEDECTTHPADTAPEKLRLGELSWVTLVDVLRACLERRLAGRSSLLVAHPVSFDSPSLSPELTATVVSPSSDEVIVVAETRPFKRKCPDDHPLEVEESVTCVENSPDVQPSVQAIEPLEHAIADVPPVEPPAKPAPVVVEPGPDKKPEVRRSARRANAVAAAAVEASRRTTRTSSDLLHNQHEDSEMIKAFLQICNDGFSDASDDACQDVISSDLIVEQLAVCSPGHPQTQTQPEAEAVRMSTWKRVVEEREEAVAVSRCVRVFEASNSGPADLILRVLTELSRIKVAQYFSTLALLWLTVRDRLHMNVPGSPEVSVLVVEALLVSGKKASKQKVRRFREAGRLLSQVRLSYTDGLEYSLLSMRIAWLWGMLHDCRGEMQLSYQAAERTLALAREIKDQVQGSVPELAGPELSGYKWDTLEEVIKGRISRLKSACDLEKAQDELRKVGAGDKEAAMRTVSILAPSVYSTIRALELHKWNANDLKFEFSSTTELQNWESRLESEIDLEPRLKMLADACIKANDLIGELVCFSVRLRMAVHYYAAKVRCENEVNSQERDADSALDSSSMRIADLLVQIRRYVLLIKKISLPNAAQFWYNEPGPSGWSTKEAASISASTVVSLTELLITMIPLAKYSSTAVELGASQKNRRLGFTRCMLAFPRCILLMYKCRQLPSSGTNSSCTEAPLSESVLTKRMLYVTSFCLRALEARGCCREEGTSGALIKLYARYLIARLHEISSDVFIDSGLIKGNTSAGGNVEDSSEPLRDADGAVERKVVSEDAQVETTGSDSSDLSANFDGVADPDYNWWDARVIRHELAQCFECLYEIPELETLCGDTIAHDEGRWLKNACVVSKHIGLAFITGDVSASVTAMEADVCRNIYFFNRRRIFEAVCSRRRGGGRVKRLREVLTLLTEALPEDAPGSVRMLSFQTLDTIVSDVVDSNKDILHEAGDSVARLQKEWQQTVTDDAKVVAVPSVRDVQLSIMYFEVFIFHAMSILDAYETEYKKQKNAERRKRPKEVADRLLTASSECLIALRCRPWSVGAWILLGRIFVEISDLALDERELCFSSFGLYHTDDIASLGDGDSIQTNFGRAEACFGFADSLLRSSWARGVSSERIPVDVPLVLGSAYDGNNKEAWYGFGDDGDLFGLFGLTNSSTSRPILRGEPHPVELGKNPGGQSLSAIRLGCAALSVLRLREFRYFHSHWTQHTLELKDLTHPNDQYPFSILELAVKALRQLREGLRLYDEDGAGDDAIDGKSSNCTSTNETNVAANFFRDQEWRSCYSPLVRARWYYTLIEAKLLRKSGRPFSEYLPVFQKALDENTSLRASQKLACDIEPLYKLHSLRMKVLRSMVNTKEVTNVLTTLERFAFDNQRPVVVDVDGAVEDEDWITVRRNTIAEDILSAMHACCENRSGIAHAEFFFKATFCRAVVLSSILNDVRGAISELSKLFGVDAAARVLDLGPDGVHRGYFYRLWNYRYTDTGVEPALETERKLVRWRSKLLGLYGALLRQSGEWRLLAAIILRLRKRVAEDLPVDGAILDDLIEAFATTRQASIVSLIERGILTDTAAFESSFRTAWHIYAETLRLSQGARRVRMAVMREEQGDTGEERLVQSGRPRCLVAIHSVLRIEHLRWLAASNAQTVDLNVLKALPLYGNIADLPVDIRSAFVNSLRAASAKWPLDEKLNKMLVKRISEYMPSDGTSLLANISVS